MAESMELFGMSELETRISKFMLKCLLPLPIVRRSYKLRLYTEYYQRKAPQLKELPTEVNEVLFIGSQFEGLSVTVTSMEGGDAVYTMSDYDIMLVLKNYLVTDGKLSLADLKAKKSKDVDLLTIHEASSPGYCRLKSVNTGKFVGMRFNPDCSGNIDIYHDGVKTGETKVPYRDFIPGTSSLDKPDTVETKMYVHGPAIAYTRIQTHPGAITRTGQEVDTVLSIKCHSWPPVASEWFKRQELNLSNWPSHETLEKVKSTGCYVVAVPHPLSHSPEQEWRYSFAPVEKILARSLTFAQRGSYIIAKMLFKTSLENVDKISSYCLKTQMFWMCSQESSWAYDEVGFYALKLLLNLSESLANGVIPHYIIPENNIICNVNASTVCEAADTLKRLVYNPFPVMKTIRQTTKFFATIEHPPDDSFKPVISLLETNSANDSDIKNRFRSSKFAILEHYCAMLKKPITNSVQEEFSKLKFAILMDIVEDIGNAKDNEESVDDVIDRVAKVLSKYNKENVQKWAAYVEEYWKCLDKIRSENVEQIFTQTFDGILKVEAF